MSNSLGPHGLQHTRLPYPSLSLSVCSNSCPLSQWCYLTISSSATLFFSSPQSCPASGSFPKSRLFTSGGQSIGASVSVLPMNIQGWFPSGLTWFNLLAVQRTLKHLLQHHSLKTSILCLFLIVQLSHPYMTTGKNIALSIRPLLTKWCFCFLIHCLGWSLLFFKGAGVF